MKLEQSPQHQQYQQRLHEARSTHAETSEQRQEKQERAQLFRMEVMLENAQCAQVLTKGLEENPNITPDELRNELRGTNMIAHPEVADRFIDQALSVKRQVLRARNFLNERSVTSNCTAAQELYRWMLKDQEVPDWRPRGEVRLDGSYPLALALFVEKQEDFDRITSGENSGGFIVYRKEIATELKTFEFPIIVVKGNPPVFATDPVMERAVRLVESHERGHAENDLLMNSVGKQQRQVVWERPQVSDDELKRLKEEAARDIKKAKRSSEWHQVLSYALGGAKHELLAQYRAVGGANNGIINNLTELGGTYDYFVRTFKIDAKDKLHTTLWNEYTRTILDADAVSKQVYWSYMRFGLIQRVETFRWVLAQIPIDQWRRQLEGALFVEEAYGLRGAELLINKIREESVGEDQTRERICNDFKSELYRNQGKSLIPAIRAFSSKLKRLQESRENEVWEFLEIESRKLVEMARSKQEMFNEVNILRREYLTLCQQRYIKPDMNFFNDFLESEGWITKEQWQKQRQETFKKEGRGPTSGI